MHINNIVNVVTVFKNKMYRKICIIGLEIPQNILHIQVPRNTHHHRFLTSTHLYYVQYTVTADNDCTMLC